MSIPVRCGGNAPRGARTLDSKLSTLNGRRREKPRARSQDAPVRPLAVAARAGFVLWRGHGRTRRVFAKENFARARFLVEPASQQAELIFEFAIALLRGRGLCWTRSRVWRSFEPLTQNLFHGARLAGKVREAQQARLVD